MNLISRCFRSSSVTPVSSTTESRSAGSIKERVCRVGLTSLFAIGGVYFVGTGVTPILPLKMCRNKQRVQV